MGTSTAAQTPTRSKVRRRAQSGRSTGPAVRIDWSQPAQREPAAQAAKGGSWQDRFVSQLRMAAERANPNAALKLHLGATAGIKPELSRL